MAVEALATVADLDWRALDDDSCLGLSDALETIDRLFHSARFSLLVELDDRDLTDRRAGHNVANHAGWRHRSDPRRVRRDLRTASRLRRLPRLSDALRTGELSVDRVREITRAVNDRNTDTLTRIQDQLADLAAAHCAWNRFARDIAHIASYADTDGAEPPRPRNHANVTRSGDTLSATIDLYGPESIGFAQRLDTEADRLYRQAVTDHEHSPQLDIPPRSELLAQAFINLIERGATTTGTGARVAPAADVTLVLDIDTDTAADLFHDGTLLPGPNHHPHSQDSPERRPVDWSTRARDLTGTPLRHSSREWEMLTCDPTYTWIITNAGGHPIACRRDERHATPAQRRALAVRDNGCVFPGCDRPPNHCDAHHIDHHAHGGPTDTTNLALLCRHHHGIIHRHGWTMTPTTTPNDESHTGYFTITTTDGTQLPTQHHQPPPPPRPAPA